jgi:hypothetical protein
MEKEHRCRISPIPRGSKSTTFGSNNVEIMPEGVAQSADHGPMTGSGDKLHYFVRKTIHTTAPNGNPRTYHFVNESCLRYEDGALTLDGTFASVVQGAEIIDGVSGRFLVAFFGNAAAVNGHYFRNLATDTSPWTLHAGAAVTNGWGAEANGADLYVLTGGSSQGRTILGEYKIAKVAPGTWTGAIADCGAGYPVGMGRWPVIDFVPHGEGVVAGTGEGAWGFNQRGKKYEPLRPLQRHLPHGLNCKGMAPSENGLFIPMADGTVYEFINGAMHEVTPWKGEAKPKDGPRGRVSFIADRGDIVVMGKESWQNFIKGPTFAALGGRVFTVIGGVGAEITAGVTDGSFATPVAANMNGFGGSLADRFIVTSPVPLYGLIPRTTRNPNGNNAYMATPEVSDGAGGFISLGTLYDATILNVANRSLVLTGFPPAAAEPAWAWDSKTAYYDAQLDSITIPTIGVTVSNQYIYRLRPAVAVAMSAPTTLDELDVIEARPGLHLPASDTSSVFIAANDHTSLAASNMLLDLYVGRRVGAGEYRDWRIPFSLAGVAGAYSACWTSAASGPLTNGASVLNIFSRFAQITIAEGKLRDPRATSFFRGVQWGTTEPGCKYSLRDIEFLKSDGEPADPLRNKEILEFVLNNRDAQEEDIAQAWVDHLDGRGAWKFGEAQGSPMRIPNSAHKGSGRRADAHFLFADSSQLDRICALIESIDMRWRYAESDTKDLDLEAARAVD